MDDELFDVDVETRMDY